MALPSAFDEKVVDATGSGFVVGNSATEKVAFFGSTPVTQPTNGAQAAMTLTTATSGGFGFVSSAAFNAFTAQLENIRANLVTLGLLKGS